MEKKVLRMLYFYNEEKAKRFIMLYEDLFQGCDPYWGGSHGEYEGMLIYHMSKENFNSLVKNGIVKKVKATFKDYEMKDYEKSIWVLC